MFRPRFAVAAALAALGLTVAACGDDEPGNPAAQPEPTTENAPSSAPVDTPVDQSAESGAAEDEKADVPAGDITKPGTELKIGETATLPFTYSKKEGTIAVTVTSMDKGTEADLKSFGDKAKGMTPYFIKAKVENLDGSDLKYASLKLKGATADGRGSGVISIGEVPGKCESESASKDFSTKGASFETCSLAITSGVEFVGASFEEGDDYERIDGKPVVWKK